MSTSLTQIQTAVRQRCDIVNSQFVSDSELTTYINASLNELYDVLVKHHGENYLVSSASFTTSPNQHAYNLPSDHYKTIGLDLVDGDDTYTMGRFNFSERNKYANERYYVDYQGLPSMKYNIVNDKLWLKPTPTAAYSITQYYIPTMTLLTGSADPVSPRILDSWIEYAIVDVCIKVKNKAEEDPSLFMAEKSALRQRIEGMVQDRGTEPDSVVDVTDDW